MLLAPLHTGHPCDRPAAFRPVARKWRLGTLGRGGLGRFPSVLASQGGCSARGFLLFKVQRVCQAGVANYLGIRAAHISSMSPCLRPTRAYQIVIEAEGIRDNVQNWRTGVLAHLVNALGLERVMQVVLAHRRLVRSADFSGLIMSRRTRQSTKIAPGSRSCKECLSKETLIALRS
jgi:hypothetical protein